MKGVHKLFLCFQSSPVRLDFEDVSGEQRTLGHGGIFWTCPFGMVCTDPDEESTLLFTCEGVITRCSATKS